MRACSLCKRVLPLGAFPASNKTRTQLSSWCRDCANRKTAEWKTENRANTRAWKEEERRAADPVHWAGLHCQHISSYVTRIVGRFEAKSGMEAPPQLLAIRDLADQLAEELPERRVGSRKPGLITCRNCGRDFRPHPRGVWQAAYCSDYCRHRFKEVIQHIETAEERKKIREKQEKDRAERLAAKHIARQRKHAERKAPLRARAEQAASLRRRGVKWKDIASSLGYSGPGHVYNDIRTQLNIDPRQLGASAGQGADCPQERPQDRSRKRCGPAHVDGSEGSDRTTKPFLPSVANYAGQEGRD